MKRSVLLTVDGVINLAFGVPLVFFPRGVASALGIPIPESGFYPSVLGGVLTGIGAALLLQRFRSGPRVHGLGIEGAISVNICGAGVLTAWLIFGGLTIPVRGYVVLWAVAVAVLGISVVELVARRSPALKGGP